MWILKGRFDNYIELKYFLEELLGLEVDLIMKGALKEELKDIILSEVYMSKRDVKTILKDILYEASRIDEFTRDINYENFIGDKIRFMQS